MADTVRNVTIRMGLKVEADHSEAIRSAKEFKSQAEAGYKSVEEEAERLRKKAEQAAEEQREHIKAYTEHVAKGREESLKAAEGFRTAAEGVFTFAQGIAFLAASSEEDLADMIETIAKIQGAFNIVKGGIDVFKGLYEAGVALQAIAQAQTLAEIELTKALAIETTVAEANTAAMLQNAAAKQNGGVVAAIAGTKIGALGSSIAIVSALLLAGVAIWDSWTKRIEGGTGEAEKAAKRIRDLADAQRTLDESSRNRGTRKEIFDIQSGGLNPEELSAASQQRFETERKRILDERDKLNAEFDKQAADAKARADEAFMKAEKEAYAARQSLNGVPIAGLWSPDFDSSGFLTPAGSESRQESRVAGTEARLARVTAEAEKLKAQEEAEKSILELARENATTQERALDAQTAIVDRKREAVRLAQDELKAERSRVETLEESFGKLKAQEQEKIRKIAEAGGPQNAKEAELLARSGIGREQASEFYRRKGREAGVGDVLSAFGQQSNTAAIEAGIEAKKQELAAAESKAEDMRKNLDDANATLLKLLDERDNTILTLFERLISQVQDVTAELDNLKNAG